ncbi:MAG: hypothetical protein JWP63_5902 [Candidatus Solibacter sp.]|nr:hypothetical protein [Candidatus Solibacter sp.]
MQPASEQELQTHLYQEWRRRFLNAAEARRGQTRHRQAEIGVIGQVAKRELLQHGKIPHVSGEKCHAAIAGHESAGILDDLVRSAAADREGKFVLRDVAPEEYQVCAWTDAEEGAPMNAEFRKTFAGRADGRWWS